MRRKVTQRALGLRAMRKLDEASGECQNLLMFLQSCYGGRVRTYDFERALRSLRKLTNAEQHALIACAIKLC